MKGKLIVLVLIAALAGLALIYKSDEAKKQEQIAQAKAQTAEQAKGVKSLYEAMGK